LSTASKVLVVLLAIFSIAFVMLTISHVAQEANWRQLATDYRTAALNAEGNLQAMLAANAAEKLALGEKIDELTKAKQGLETQLKQAREELADAKSDLQAAMHQNESNANALTKLTGELNVINTEAAELRTQRNALENENLNLQRRNIDLGERVRELTIQTATMAQQIRQLQQLNFAKDEEIRRLQGDQPGAAAGGLAVLSRDEYAQPVTPTGETPVRGSIISVDGNLASISVGSADRVHTGMRFVIYDGATYLGDLLITDTEPNEAVGTVENTQGIIRPGNQAISLVGLSSAF
jgi:hypothetical protein